MLRRLPVLVVLAGILSAWASSPRLAASQSAPQPKPRFKSGLEIVIVNVVVRDKDGNLVRGLTMKDFTILEDNKPQTISTFDFEELDNVATTIVAPVMPSLKEELKPAVPAPAKPAGKPAAPEPKPAVTLKDRRIMVLFFDLSSMQPEDVGRAAESARQYVNDQLSPADTMAIVSFSTSIAVDQDFTSDKAELVAALNRLSPVEGSAFAEQPSGEDAPDTGAAYTPDDTEFTIFNTDRRLEALRALADTLADIEQKKSVIYFSSGMTQSGLDNEASLRLVIDHAVRANVSIYAADTRGLSAVVPGGDASQASARGGASAFSGRGMAGARDRFSASQDTLTTLAEDTGGKAFFDRNDFGEVFAQVVKDTTAYYLLGYSSTNPAQDGRYRRIRVRVNRPDLKLEYRSGYFAPRDFAHSGRDDRAQQMQEFLLMGLPPTDLPIHADVGYFRVGENRYYVPLWLVVPGSEVPFSTSRNQDRATLDVLGVVRNQQQRPVAFIQDTVKLNVDATKEVRRKNVQYATSFELPPGRYHLRVVIRENQDGTIGSLDTTLVIPDVTQQKPELSSVIMVAQRMPAAKKRTNPLVQSGQELVGSVTKVVQRNQPLTFFYEIYDPGTPPAPPPGAPGTPASSKSPNVQSPVRVLSNVAFYKGIRRVYQTGLVSAEQLNVKDRRAVAFEVNVPPGVLEPGLYTCQVNIVDDVAGTFAFPRMPLYVLR
ncbi:MAG: VWA domain-containing protein [Acidobacteriota bacterium]